MKSAKTLLMQATSAEPSMPILTSLLQRAAITPSPVHEVPPIVHEVLHSSGQPLYAKCYGDRL
jgi:hypothetical protein